MHYPLCVFFSLNITILVQTHYEWNNTLGLWSYQYAKGEDLMVQ